MFLERTSLIKMLLRGFEAISFHRAVEFTVRLNRGSSWKEEDNSEYNPSHNIVSTRRF